MKKIMSPRVTIKIDREIIEAAKRRDSSHCMIAEAIKAAVPDAKSVSVDLASIRWTDPKRGLRYTYLTPRTAQLELIRFDQGDETIEPFSFHLRGAMVTASKMKKAGAEKLPTKATLGERSGTHKGEVPERIGGKTPPIGPLSNHSKVRVGLRREFGLRRLSR